MYLLCISIFEQIDIPPNPETSKGTKLNPSLSEVDTVTKAFE
jgi:hypothetical protein